MGKLPDKIKIKCRFEEYPNLVCDEDGVFWVLPHFINVKPYNEKGKPSKRFVPLRRVKRVNHMGSWHINYQFKRTSIKTLREKATLVDEIFDVPDKSKLPF